MYRFRVNGDINQKDQTVFSRDCDLCKSLLVFAGMFIINKIDRMRVCKNIRDPGEINFMFTYDLFALCLHPN